MKKKKVSVWQDHQNWSWVKIANFEANSSGFQASQQSTSLIIHRKFQLSICCILEEAQSVFLSGFQHSRAHWHLYVVSSKSKTILAVLGAVLQAETSTRHKRNAQVRIAGGLAFEEANFEESRRSRLPFENHKILPLHPTGPSTCTSYFFSNDLMSWGDICQSHSCFRVKTVLRRQMKPISIYVAETGKSCSTEKNPFPQELLV